MRFSSSPVKVIATVISILTLSTGLSVAGDTSLELPKLFDQTTIDRYRSLQDSAYSFLENSDYDNAITYFHRQMEAIPEAVWPPYNLACAYSRKGDLDEAYSWMGKAVENGFDDVDQCEYDPDLESMRNDTRWDGLIKSVEEQAGMQSKVYAAGLKNYAKAPMTFDTEDALDQWADKESALLRAHRAVYPTWKRTLLSFDMEAKRLAALRDMKGADFDYDFERILVLTKTRSIWEDNWGTLCDAIEKEVSSYLKAHPTGEKASEVRYRGGLSALLHCGMDNTADKMWSENVERARAYLTAVDQNNKYFGAAQGLILASSLAKAGDNRDSKINEVKAFINDFGNDKEASRIGMVFFADDMIKAAWPIPISGTDINGQPISLDQFHGKYVLLDFWAIWCGPCRMELPHLVEAYNKYKDAGVVFLSVSLDYKKDHTVEDLKAWTTEKGMTWNHIYDGMAWDSPYPKSYFVGSIPSPFLIGPNGELVAHGDKLRGDDLDKTLAAALMSQSH